MSIQSVSSLLSVLSSQASATTNSSSTQASTSANELAQSILAGGGDNTSATLYSTLVSLSKASTSDTQDTATYNAKGMLLEVRRNLAINNPLYGSDTGSTDATSSYFDSASTGTDATSQLQSLVQSMLSAQQSSKS